MEKNESIYPNALTSEAWKKKFEEISNKLIAWGYQFVVSDPWDFTVTVKDMPGSVRMRKNVIDEVRINTSGITFKMYVHSSEAHYSVWFARNHTSILVDF